MVKKSLNVHHCIYSHLFTDFKFKVITLCVIQFIYKQKNKIFELNKAEIPLSTGRIFVICLNRTNNILGRKTRQEIK
jgi:hypothetical protein